MSLREWQTQLSRALLLEKSGPPGDLPALQGIAEEQITLYEELLFNTVLEALQNIYPYTYKLFSREGEADAEWRRLAETFRRAHPNSSYKLMGAVSTFPAFLEQQADWMAQYPFLADLALYEWLEMVVLNFPSSDFSAPSPDTPLELSVVPVDQWSVYAPCWNPTRQLHGFQFNIPNILEYLNTLENWVALWDANDFIDPVFSENPVDILIYRDPHTLEARFFCLNALTAALIRDSSAPDRTYEQVISALLERTPSLKTVPGDILRAQAFELFRICQENGILTGSLPAGSPGNFHSP